MRRKGSRRFEDDEPKAVKEMKKNKKIEENSKRRKSTKKEKKKKRKKIILSVIIVFILILGITLGVSGHTWITLAKDMVSNESSIVIDIECNTIAKLRR